MSVTGFTGQVSTGGLTEFATRAFDPKSRVWLQDDSYRGTTTRAASMNRYAYVEGAPESFVDVLEFYRARAAVRAQALAAAQAAYDAALKAYNAIVSNVHMQARLFQREMGQILAQAAQRAASAQWAMQQAAKVRAAAAAAAKREADSRKNWWDRASKAASNVASSVWDGTKAAASVVWEGTKMAASAAWDRTKALASTTWDGTKALASTTWDGTKIVASAAWDRGSTLAQYSLQTTWRRVTDPVQTVYDSTNGNIFAEDTMALLQIVGADAELRNEGDYCGTAGMCLTSNWTPVAYDSEGVAQRQAITIGHTVTFPSGEKINTPWVEHEFTHVLQYEAMGGIGFGLDYGVEQFWGVVVQHESKETAYQNQSTEQMARAVANDPNVEPGKNPLGHWFETKG